MGLVPKSLIDEWDKNECIIYFNDVRPSGGVDCEPIWDKIYAQIADLNIYDFFRANELSYPPDPSSAEDRIGRSMVNGTEKTYRKGMTQAEYTPWLKHIANKDRLMYSSFTEYMNDEAVRTALHIPSDVPAWEECNMGINESY